MSKGLEALEHLVDGNMHEVNYYRQFSYATAEIMKDKETIEKDLKALSLLKKHLRFIKGWYVDQSNWSYDEILIRIENTDRWNKEEKEDFKVIKEWLENDN